MILKTWTLAAALAASSLGLNACVDGRDRYDPGYARSRPILIERDRYEQDGRRRGDQDYRRDFRRGEGDRLARRDEGRLDRSPRQIDERRRSEFCRRSPDAPICGNDRDRRY